MLEGNRCEKLSKELENASHLLPSGRVRRSERVAPPLGTRAVWLTDMGGHITMMKDDCPMNLVTSEEPSSRGWREGTEIVENK